LPRKVKGEKSPDAVISQSTVPGLALLKKPLHPAIKSSGRV
jgi:hypothetical protein